MFSVAWFLWTRGALTLALLSFQYGAPDAGGLEHIPLGWSYWYALVSDYGGECVSSDPVPYWQMIRLCHESLLAGESPVPGVFLSLVARAV